MNCDDGLFSHPRGREGLAKTRRGESLKLKLNLHEAAELQAERERAFTFLRDWDLRAEPPVLAKPVEHLGCFEFDFQDDEFVSSFAPLQLDDHFILRAFKGSLAGTWPEPRVVFALPRDDAEMKHGAPSKGDWRLNLEEEFPQALPDFMAAIVVGDDITSYLKASVLKRDLNYHFGHRLENLIACVGDIPSPSESLLSVLQTRNGVDLLPSVERTGEQVAVEFYTYTDYGKEEIVCYRDFYSIGSCVLSPTSNSQTFAQGEGGYIYG